METLNVKGFRLELDGASLYKDGKPLDRKARKLSEMRDVLMDPGAINSKSMDDETYFMFRALSSSDDSEAFKKYGVRYDVTIMEDYKLGMELNKTFGHYHPEAERGLSYPEVYEVIKGNAVMLLQKKLNDTDYEVILVHAETGDKVIVEPNYGHITINAGPGRLVTANLVSEQFIPDYKSIENKHGGAVYLTADDKKLRNKNYGNASVSEDRNRPVPPFLGGSVGIYDSFIKTPDKFRFLNKPSLMGELL
jgi:glucose-6-phosphate isomerase